jgi:hypothetical protein
MRREMNAASPHLWRLDAYVLIELWVCEWELHGLLDLLNLLLEPTHVGVCLAGCMLHLLESVWQAMA